MSAGSKCAAALMLAFSGCLAMYLPGAPVLGRTAPAIQGEDIDGNVLLLEAYRGKVVVLHFWHTT